jgi:hypothetical protein
MQIVAPLAGVALAALMSTTALAGEITTRDFTVTSGGATLAATLHLPAGHQPGAKLPTVVVTGSWTSVKEQMPTTYAKALAARGIAAVTFDFRGWGEAGDLPNGQRFIESPTAKIEDIRATVAALSGLPEVDAAAIHGLGICASAGYMVDAAIGNGALRTVSLVAPWLQNQAIVNEVYGGEAGVAGLIAMSRKAEAAGGEIIKAAGPEGATDALMPIGGYYYEPTRGAIPAYDNKWNQAGWEGWLTYHPANSAPKLTQPLTIVHSDAAAIPHGTRAFLAGYGGTASVTWLNNIDQFSFYDRVDAVEAAVSQVAKQVRAGSAS